MKVALLLFACLSLAAAQSAIFNTAVVATLCALTSTNSGCDLSSVLAVGGSALLTSGNSVLDFSQAGANLQFNINLDINVQALVVTSNNIVTIASGYTATTTAFAVNASSQAIVAGTLKVNAAVNTATAVYVAAGSTINVTANGAITTGANVEAAGQATVAGTITTTGNYAQSAGNLILQGTATATGATGGVIAAANVNVAASATVSGNGVIGSTGASTQFNLDGSLNIGNSPGAVTVNGDWRPGAFSTFNLEIASANDNDRLFVTGQAYLAGFVRVTLLNNYVPPDNTRFIFITSKSQSGQFASTTGGLAKWTSQTTTSAAGAQTSVTYNSAVSVAISGLVVLACVLASLL